ncbi:hypothetical protein PPYR_07420 [Photinus pyralis]|uniref:Integrase core domain-containing protein n=1 Tax=Photinus pyralis TaxID=7054 RepID=A0A5N4AQD6_PHOPY|nr:hypothetical protein PPYR_07420 [Photinus pyralis]
MDDAEVHAVYYFLLGLSYTEILAMLSFCHGFHLSLSTLKRKLNCLGLYRKKHFSELHLVVNFIEQQLQSSGQLHGYRWMHLKCIQHGLTVTREAVRMIINELDPIGVTFRTRKRLRRRKYSTRGPNFVWHVDSYDKLKPYGIAINGAIDGFSRHIMWLKAGRTASDPKVIGGYFLEAIEKYGGCPRRLHNTDVCYGDRSFLYGTSQANQRIESWGSILRKQNAQFWMNIFQSLKEDGYFSGTYLDKSLIRFCFMAIIQKELAQVELEWNTHRIAASRNSISPKGRPIVLFELPQAYYTQTYICQVTHHDLNICKQESSFLYLPCDVHVYQLCKLIMREKNLREPSDSYEAVNLYLTLREEIMSQIL